jgi:hypothetical protein
VTKLDIEQGLQCLHGNLEVDDFPLETNSTTYEKNLQQDINAVAAEQNFYHYTLVHQSRFHDPG